MFGHEAHEEFTKAASPQCFGRRPVDSAFECNFGRQCGCCFQIHTRRKTGCAEGTAAYIGPKTPALRPKAAFAIFVTPSSPFVMKKDISGRLDLDSFDIATVGWF